MDLKSRLFLKQNNFTPYFSLILEMFETLLGKIVFFFCICCLLLLLFVCFIQNLIFFYSSTRTQLEDLHKFDQKKTLEQVFGKHDFTKLLGSCRRLRLGYLEKYFLKKCFMFCACGLYNRLYHWIRIIKFFLARLWDFIWRSSGSTYEQRLVSDVTNEFLLAEPFPNPPTPLKVNSRECFPFLIKISILYHKN